MRVSLYVIKWMVSGSYNPLRLSFYIQTKKYRTSYFISLNFLENEVDFVVEKFNHFHNLNESDFDLRICERF